MPPVGNQGRQGSCVAWATTYALKSYQEKVERNWKYDIEWTLDKEWVNSSSFYIVAKPKGSMQTVFSPAFVYNQINRGVDQGSYIGDALELLVRQGAPPLSVMPYNDKDYRTKPNSYQIQQAFPFRGKRYSHIEPNNIEAIKAELAKGNPVVFGMKLHEGFSRLKTEVYDSISGSSLGGHAMTLVGYDDNKVSARGYKGAFKLINSWGENWGDKGYGWVSYRMFAAMTHDAWVLEDIQEQAPVVEDVPKLESPKNVRASQGTYSDKILIEWDKVELADAYLIRKYLGDDDTIDEITVSETYYEDTEVELNVTYQYQVFSIQMIDEENYQYSDDSTAQLVEGYASEAPEQELEKVLGLKLVLNNKKEVEISWYPVQNAKSYEVFRYNNKAKDWQKLFSTQKTSGIDKTPQKGENNYYVVRAIKDSIIGPWSESEGIFLESINTLPSKITDLRATYGKVGGIQLSWTKSENVQKYHIIQYNSSNDKAVHLATIEGNTYFDSSSLASSGNLLVYTIIPENPVGRGEVSNPASGLGLSKGFFSRGVSLLPPEEVGYKLQAGKFQISWKPVPQAAEYYVYLKAPGKDWSFLASVGNKTEFEFFIPEKNKLYAIAIKSKAAMGGESTFSKPIVLSMGESKKLPKHRFLAEAGIQNFVGNWISSYMDENGKPWDVRLEITNNGNQFSAHLYLNGKKTNTYTGTYKILADFLKTKDFYLEAKTKTGKISDLLSLRLTNSPLNKKTIEIRIARE